VRYNFFFQFSEEEKIISPHWHKCAEEFASMLLLEAKFLEHLYRIKHRLNLENTYNNIANTIPINNNPKPAKIA